MFLHAAQPPPPHRGHLPLPPHFGHDSAIFLTPESVWFLCEDTQRQGILYTYYRKKKYTCSDFSI